MSLERLGTWLELKTVDYGQRVISGYAAVHSNTDRVDDVIDAGAFRKTLAARQPAEVGVFIGHRTDTLPVGIPLKLVADAKGLYSETLVKPGPAGDDLLATAKFMAEHGRPLGMSIGFRIPAGGAHMDRVSGKTVRRITEIDLVEYSYAAGQAIANPEALVTGTKAGGSSVKVEQRDGKWYVTDEAGKDVSDGFDSEAAAMMAMRMMKTAGGDGAEAKAEWTAAYLNDLPDSAFLHIEAGGQKDEGGRTVPRTLRHFPYKDADGKVDLAHLRNAVARIPQSGLGADLKSRLQARARTLLENTQAGKLSDPSSDWEDGAPLSLKYIAYQALDLADQIGTEHRAMRLLGDDTKADRRIRPPLRTTIRELAQQLAALADRAEYEDRETDGAADIQHRRRRLALLEV